MNIAIQPGVIVLMAGMFVALIFCARQWDKGTAFRYAPPIYGLIAGVFLALLWRTPTTTIQETLEVIAGFCAAGWVFWFAIWVEKRNDGNDKVDASRESNGPGEN